MEFVQENNRTPIEGTYDVAVCGGGIAGIAAALAAARHGAKTVLFERQFMLGGLGTAGLITIYLPICDGYGRQVSFGLAEELLRQSIRDGAEDKYPDNWLDGDGPRTREDKRYQVRYNAQLFAIRAEQMLLEAGVNILYGTYAVGTQVQNGKITHLITENKSGRRAWTVKSVVDATGDADIAQFAGVPTATFGAGNIPAGWYYSTGKEGYALHMVGALNAESWKKAREKVEGKAVLLGLDGQELSDYVHTSHMRTYEDFLNRREQDPTLFPVTMATVPQLRMTRRIKGAYELDESEVHTRFDDSIGMVSDWRNRGPVFEVPFRTLYAPEVKNLLTAGRCTSVTDLMWDIMRVIPCCAVTGQAAGTAAAMGDDFTALDVAKLQKVLERDDVVLHEDQLTAPVQ